jgi:hypothetical protein
MPFDLSEASEILTSKCHAHVDSAKGEIGAEVPFDLDSDRLSSLFTTFLLLTIPPAPTPLGLYDVLPQIMAIIAVLAIFIAWAEKRLKSTTKRK